MKSITKYVANDGSEWTTREDAEKHDALDAQVRDLERQLGPRIERSGERRRIDTAVWAEVKRRVVDLCREHYPNEAIFKHDAAEIHPMSFAGRLLSDGGGPLNRIWSRFCCSDGTWEYEQPYYAINAGAFECDYPDVASQRSAGA